MSDLDDTGTRRQELQLLASWRDHGQVSDNQWLSRPRCAPPRVFDARSPSRDHAHTIRSLVACVACPCRHGRVLESARYAAAHRRRQKVDPVTASVLMGKVTFTGVAPAPAIRMAAADPELHRRRGAESAERRGAHTDGGLQNVFVREAGPRSGLLVRRAHKAVEIDQHGCMYAARARRARRPGDSGREQRQHDAQRALAAGVESRG